MDHVADYRLYQCGLYRGVCAVRLTKEDVERLAEDDNEVVAKTAKIVLKNQFDEESEDSK